MRTSESALNRESRGTLGMVPAGPLEDRRSWSRLKSRIVYDGIGAINLCLGDRLRHFEKYLEEPELLMPGLNVRGPIRS